MNVNQLNTWARIIDALARYGQRTLSKSVEADTTPIESQRSAKKDTTS